MIYLMGIWIAPAEMRERDTRHGRGGDDRNYGGRGGGRDDGWRDNYGYQRDRYPQRDEREYNRGYGGGAGRGEYGRREYERDREYGRRDGREGNYARRDDRNYERRDDRERERDYDQPRPRYRDEDRTR